MVRWVQVPPRTLRNRLLTCGNAVRRVPALAAARAAGLPKAPRFHDLRHTYVAWAVASGADLPYIQAQLGHESITTTIDTYGHLMPNSNRHVTHAFDRALRGGKIERYQGLTAAR